MTNLWWSASALLIVVGVVCTVVPVLPGALVVYGGILLGAWIDGYARIPVWLLILLGVLAAAATTVDYLAAAAGARRAGASPRAMLGATLGTLAGIFSGLWGLLFLPLLGAAIGQYLDHPDLARAGRVGFATWIGLLLGSAAKIAIVLTMLGIYLVALVF